MHLTRRTGSIAALLTALAVVITPALLLAHARLVKSAPAADERLTAVPTALSLWFSERPEPKFTKIELLDSAGAPVALGAVAVIAGDAMGVTIPIATSLANGRYTVAWRTAAADGHPSTGKFSFSVDAEHVAPMIVVDTAVAPQRKSPSNIILEPAEGTVFSTSARWAELVAVLTLIGVVVFALVVLPDAGLPEESKVEAVDRARRLASSVLVLFAITTLWRLSASADLIPSVATSRMAAMMIVVRDTGWGHAWTLGAAGGLLVAAGLLVAKRFPFGWALAGLGMVAICFGESLTGHAGALTRRGPLAVGVDIAHMLGAGGWLGGLAALVMAGLPATNRLRETDRRGIGQQLVRAYHKAALQCVALVLITAAISAWLRLSSPSDLWATPYGRIVLLKLTLAAGLLGFGWYHWRVVVTPEWNDDTGFRFKRSAAGELILGAAVLAATAVLVSTALPSSSP